MRWDCPTKTDGKPGNRSLKPSRLVWFLGSGGPAVPRNDTDPQTWAFNHWVGVLFEQTQSLDDEQFVRDSKLVHFFSMLMLLPLMMMMMTTTTTTMMMMMAMAMAMATVSASQRFKLPKPAYVAWVWLFLQDRTIHCPITRFIMLSHTRCAFLHLNSAWYPSLKGIRPLKIISFASRGNESVHPTLLKMVIYSGFSHEKWWIFPWLC